MRLPARVVQKTFAARMQIEIVSQTFRSVGEKGVPPVDKEWGEGSVAGGRCVRPEVKAFQQL